MGKGLRIVSFRCEPGQMKAFADFGRDLYRHDPGPAAHSEGRLLDMLSKPSFLHSGPGKEYIHFLALAGGRVKGRISAFVNRDLHDRDGRSVGALGLFESVEDYRVAEALLGSGMEWLSRRKGVGRIWAPLNMDIWHGYRLMTGGFEEKPFYGEPRNKPYYGGFFERFGFVPSQRWNSFGLPGREALEEVHQRGLASYNGLVERGYRFDYFRKDRFHKDLETFHSILTASFSRFTGFTPLPFCDFHDRFSSMRDIMEPRFFIFAFDEKGLPVGFVGVLPDLGNGKQPLLYVIGVTPEESPKGKGLGKALLSRVLEEVLVSGCTDLLVALVAEGSRCRGLFGEFSSDRRREYTLYEVSL